MHSFHGKTCNIHFNSDMSGDIHIVSLLNNTEIQVAADDILDFVAEYVRREKIDKLEQMDSKEVLGIETRKSI